MKNMKISIVAMMVAIFSVLGANEANAQITTGEQVIAAANNLVNVQVGSVNVNAVDLIDVSDVDVDVNALNNILVNIEIDDTLNNLLRQAELIKENQIVVGVLSDQKTYLIKVKEPKK